MILQKPCQVNYEIYVILVKLPQSYRLWPILWENFLQHQKRMKFRFLFKKNQNIQKIDNDK